MKKRLALSKQRLSPHIQSHSTTITHDLQIFHEEAKSLHNEFLSSDCLSSQCDSTNAHTLINEHYKKLLSLQAQTKDLMELQELLTTKCCCQLQSAQTVSVMFIYNKPVLYK